MFRAQLCPIDSDCLRSQKFRYLSNCVPQAFNLFGQAQLQYANGETHLPNLTFTTRLLFEEPETTWSAVDQ